MFIELENLVAKYHDRRALDGMSARFTARSVGLLGPNGAGKSTLMKVLMGFLKPAEGTARIMGLDIRKEKLKVRQLIGYMPEHESYIAGLSAVRLLRYVGELSGLSSRQAMERAHEVLYYVGMGELRYRPVDTYSLGNQQRVKLAQALVHGPKILILDEPTNALDPQGRDEMLHLVRDIGDISGSFVVMCSHILHDVEFCCEDVTVMNHGKVILSGNINELKQEDMRTYDIRVEGDRERFLGAIASLGWKCDEDDQGVIRVQLPDGENTRSIFRIAAEIGVQLRHFHFKRDSLEDIFVQALQQSNQEASHAGT
jgi:ABC-2 type transport system ATP-binding protein